MLSPADSTAVRERIARRCGVEADRLTPQTNLIRDLHADGASLGFFLVLLESALDVKVVGTFKRILALSRVDANGCLTPKAREDLQELLPGIELDITQPTVVDDLWTVATIEVVDALETLERFADTGKSKTALRDAQRVLAQWRLERVPELKALHVSLAACRPCCGMK